MQNIKIDSANQAINLNRLAIQNINTGKTDTALFLLNASISFDSTYYPAYLNRANLLKMKGKYAEAIRDYIHVKQYDPWVFNQMVAAYSIGALLIDLKYFAVGIQVLDTAEKIVITMDNDDFNNSYRASILSYKAEANYCMGTLKKGIVSAKESLKYDSINSYVYLLLGNLYNANGESDSACMYFEKSLLRGQDEALDSIKKYCSK